MSTLELQQKYDQERDKRLRKENTNQYVSVRDSAIQDLAKDPFIDYAALAAQKPPLKDGDDIRVLVVGAGHCGLIMAGRLVEAGVSAKEIVVVDYAGGWGGVWYWNRYPGLMCDVEAYCYLPFLQETGFKPKHKYSYGEEIRANAEFAAKHYGLQGMFSTRIKSQIWDETTRRWVVTMTQDFGGVQPNKTLTVKAQFVLMAGGGLNVPKVPKIDGFRDFWAKNAVFHTARWDYKITGGSQEQPDLTKLAGKRVAIVGTGSTGVQVVPHLAKWASQVYVVQRTPSYCGERKQQETTPEVWAQVANAPDWQTKRRWNFNTHLTGHPDPVDLVNDGWSANGARSGLTGSTAWVVAPGQEQDHIRRLAEMDAPHAEALRNRIKTIVKNQETAEKLQPWYHGWCKRPTFNDDYLESFNEENVTLVDTNGRGIERFTDKGFVVAGQEYEIDLLVLATGFSPSPSMTPSQGLNAPIAGRGGRSLDDWWNNLAEFATLFGLATSRFPNLFFYQVVGTAISYNVSWMYDTCARFIARVITEALRQSDKPDEAVVEVVREAELRWTEDIVKHAGWMAALSICTPGLINNEGKALTSKPTGDELAFGARKATWGLGPNAYRTKIDEYIAKTENTLEGFVLD